MSSYAKYAPQVVPPFTSNTILQSGNTFGADMVIGTTDNFNLDFMTNNVVKFQLTNASGQAALNPPTLAGTAQFLTLKGGGSSTTDGGSITIQGGAAAAGFTGGAATVRAGTATGAVQASSATLLGGSNTATGPAGSAIVQGGPSSGSGQPGGNVVLKTGNASGGGGATVGQVQVLINSTLALTIDNNSNIIPGVAGTRLNTTATNGFQYLNSCAGTPTGVPATLPTGKHPMVYDDTNDILYVYSTAGSVWKKVALT